MTTWEGAGRHKIAEWVVGRQVRLVGKRRGRTEVPPLHEPKTNPKQRRKEKGRTKVPPYKGPDKSPSIETGAKDPSKPGPNQKTTLTAAPLDALIGEIDAAKKPS